MGIDVRQYAMANQSFTRASCVGCGLCAHVCPRGVLKLENKPDRRPHLSEGERVRITVERVEQARPEDILQLAARVYEGLSTEDIDEIDEMARRRPFFSDAHR